MEGDESFERSLKDIPDFVAVLMGGFPKFFLIVMGNAADKMDGIFFCGPVDAGDVSLEELAEAVDEEVMDGCFFSMAGTEGGEACQKAVGEWLSVHFLNDAFLTFACFVEELLYYALGQLLFQDVTCQAFADVGSAAFVAQNVAEGGVACVECGAVVIAGVAACAQNADDAWLVLAQASCSAKYVAFDIDGGMGTDDLLERMGNDGRFLFGAAGSVEMDDGQWTTDTRQRTTDDGRELGEHFLFQGVADFFFCLLIGIDALCMEGVMPVSNEAPCCFC